MQTWGLEKCLLHGTEVGGAWGDAECMGDPDVLILSY